MKKFSNISGSTYHASRCQLILAGHWQAWEKNLSKFNLRNFPHSSIETLQSQNFPHVGQLVVAGAQRECCNGQYCCGKEFFDQLKQLPCVNHLGCKDLGYGNFCCPPKGNSTEASTCCNEDPNPTTTTTSTTPRPRSGQLAGSSSGMEVTFFVVLLAPLLLLRK